MFSRSDHAINGRHGNSVTFFDTPEESPSPAGDDWSIAVPSALSSVVTWASSRELIVQPFRVYFSCSKASSH